MCDGYQLLKKIIIGDYCFKKKICDEKHTELWSGRDIIEVSDKLPKEVSSLP